MGDYINQNSGVGAEDYWYQFTFPSSRKYYVNTAD